MLKLADQFESKLYPAIEQKAGDPAVRGIVESLCLYDIDLSKIQMPSITGDMWKTFAQDHRMKMTFQKWKEEHGADRNAWDTLREIKDHCIVQYKYERMGDEIIRLNVGAFGYHRTGAWKDITIDGRGEYAAQHFFSTAEGQTSLYLDNEHRERTKLSKWLTAFSEKGQSRILKESASRALTRIKRYDPSLKRQDLLWPYRLMKIFLKDFPKSTSSMATQTEDCQAVNHLLEIRNETVIDSAPINLIDLGDNEEEDSIYESDTDYDSRPYTPL